MNYKEILKLLEAGYTRDEINALHEEEINNPEPKQPKQPEPKQPKQPEQQEPKAAQPTQPGLDAQSAIAALLGKMDQKLTELQAANILAMQQPGGQEKEKTPEDILGELMRPEPRK